MKTSIWTQKAPRWLAMVGILFVVAACSGAAAERSTTATQASTPIPTLAPTPTMAPTQPLAPTQSTGPVAVVGSRPARVDVTVGTHGLEAGVTCQVLGDGGLSVYSGPADGDEFAVVFRSDGTVANLSGSFRGIAWKVTQNPYGTLHADKSGTFSGMDAISGAAVSGTFAC